MVSKILNVKSDSMTGELIFLWRNIFQKSFRTKKKELWMIESKFYSESRFDIKTIKASY